MNRQELEHQIAQYAYGTATGSGEVTHSGGINCVYPSVVFRGACQQGGTPTPASPVPIKVNNAEWTTPVWNQLVENGNFESIIGWKSTRASSRAELNIATLAAVTGNPFYFSRAVNYTKGHTYLFSVHARSVNDYYFKFRFQTDDNNTSIQGDFMEATADWELYASIIAIPADTTMGVTRFTIRTLSSAATAGDAAELKNAMLIDLTLLFGSGNEPATVEEFEAWAEAHGRGLSTYQPYDTGTPLGGAVDLSQLPDGGLRGIGDAADVWDSQSGDGFRRTARIASYDGEDVGENWISTTGQLTTGAEVIYEISPASFHTTPQPVIQPDGQGRLRQADGDIDDTKVEVTYVKHG